MKNTPEYRALMQALSNFLNSDHGLIGPDVAGFMEFLWRFVPLADSCDRCRRRDGCENSILWPLTVEPDGADGYKATYECHRCGLRSFVCWSEDMANSIDHGATTIS